MSAEGSVFVSAFIPSFCSLSHGSVSSFGKRSGGVSHLTHERMQIAKTKSILVSRGDYQIKQGLYSLQTLSGSQPPARARKRN
jgi:hypothetical protein